MSTTEQQISTWIDDHISATWQHIALCALIYAPVAWFLGNAAGFMAALAWNTSREIRDAQKGSGFGWKTLLIPDALCIAAFLIGERLK